MSEINLCIQPWWVMKEKGIYQGAFPEAANISGIPQSVSGACATETLLHDMLGHRWIWTKVQAFCNCHVFKPYCSRGIQAGA